MIVWTAAAAWLRANRGFALVLAAGFAVAALWAALGLAVQVGERRQAGREEAQRAAAALQIVRADARVKEALAAERQQSALAMARQQQVLETADDQETDARPSAARRAYLCGVLRSRSGAGANLPADCRP